MFIKEREEENVEKKKIKNVYLLMTDKMTTLLTTHRYETILRVHLMSN